MVSLFKLSPTKRMCIVLFQFCLTFILFQFSFGCLWIDCLLLKINPWKPNANTTIFFNLKLCSQYFITVGTYRVFLPKFILRYKVLINKKKLGVFPKHCWSLCILFIFSCVLFAVGCSNCVYVFSVPFFLLEYKEYSI